MSSSNNLGDVFTGGATTSQHVEAEDDDHFENTTFKLKRTRSLGLLDEFIQPSEVENAKSGEVDSKGKSEISSGNKASPLDGSSINKEGLEVDNDALVDDNEEDRESYKVQSPVALKSPEMLPHDDTDIQYEPSRHVDYLSHQWDVSDISKSWRYVIQKRKDVANSARLENASWRTWAQRRSNLKTINPEVVNWSKDSDVTWLYGPIMKDEEHGEADDEDNHKRITTATSAVAGDISIPNKQKKGPKPILKRRTVQDMMISHSNLLKLQLATNRMHDKQRQEHESQTSKENQPHNENEPPEFDDYDAISAKLNSQYKNIDSQNNSMVNLQNLNDDKKTESTSSDQATNKDTNNQSNNTSSDNTTAKPSNNEAVSTGTNSTSSSSPIPKKDRRIHFNDVVQQCIAVDEYSDEDDDDYYDDDEEDYYYDDEEEDYMYETPHEDQDDSGDDENEDDDDDEGGFFLKVKSPSSPNVPVPGLSLSANKENNKNSNNDNTEDTDSISTTNSKFHRSIHLLPSTTLNCGSSDEESDDDNPYTSSLSHNANNRGYDYYYDYNTVYTCDPDHAIYGLNDKNNSKTPDVVDVPDNITLGSNFDYEVIENEEFNNDKMPIIDPSVINSNNLNYPISNHNNSKSVSESNDSGNKVQNAGVAANDNSQGFVKPTSPDASNIKSSAFSFSNSDSEDDSDDSDDGLSISTKNSSQSLAQLVFTHNMTRSSNNDDEHQYPTYESQPVTAPVSSINPRHSSTSISKQSTSSNSLSQLFFGGGLTKQDQNQNQALALSFFGTNDGQDEEIQDQGETISSLDTSQLQRTLSNTQRKASPLPPHTTSANAFLGNTTPPLERQPKKTFSFDSGSDSEEEANDVIAPPRVDNSTPSYASLSQVADKNGIRSPSPDVNNIGSPQLNSNNSNSSTHGNQNKNIVGQAKGLANHLLGNWKNNE
ncbi:uncharacterized protein AC631_05218 [Debaryomyces fabryi]|uniref:Nitrogen regulatory protein areA GATA-like domain-containing protein n=1 Tax=Debaryomyces fabryi TaxID=58627 RepID=A0A0V1PS23_9ASCO|nr:uncharacterized protein AC631_05218 [Debaryomyces fabryi]KRZ99030.1 hypothetical protein AC631_05218 [Debaryomyces fabryi]CUM57057.1 unnamed protein product [Debaryomyces fabryi]